MNDFVTELGSFQMIGHMISNSTVGPKTLSISLMRLFLDFHLMTYVRDLHTLISVLAALGSTKKPPGHPTTYDTATTEKTPNGLIFKLPFFFPKFCLQFPFWKISVVM